MRRFTLAIASALDSTARGAYTTGKQVAGEIGGKVADAISHAVLGPIRSRIDTPCTCGTDCNL